MKTKVCVLFGGDSMEREVSLLTCNEILNSIDRNKFEVTNIFIKEDKDTVWIKKLMDLKPDIVLSALHGGKGENGSVQGLLECLHIPYVGSKVTASAVAMDKQMSKLIMKVNNIPTIESIYLNSNETLLNYEEKIKELEYPLVVKPNSGGASIGIKIVNNYDELIIAMENAKKFDETIIIEKYIKGKEISCALVETKNGVEVLNILDVDTNNKIYDFDAKYIDNRSFIKFSKIPDYQKTMIKEIGKQVFKIIKCKGIGVVDMIVDDEQVYVLEINTLPGFTSKSIIPKAVSNKSDFTNFLSQIIEFELERNK